MQSIKELSKIILQKFYEHHSDHVFTVAISGIDASGKGYISKLLEDKLTNKGFRVANINLDPWQNPIPIRLQNENAAENFYENVFRWSDVFEQLIIPLRNNRSIKLTTSLIRTEADEYYNHSYHYKQVDILLIDAIFLFQEKLLPYYDFKVWIECSFDTGLKRAMERNVERLSEDRLIADYNTYYYAAQRYHFKKDNPETIADIIYCNDKVLGTVGQVTVNF